MQDNLAKLRRKINLIDARIIYLISLRAIVAVKIGKYKKQYGYSVCDDRRELALRSWHRKCVQATRLVKYSVIRQIFITIMSFCKSLQ